jgi:aryl-alcohol dehydrogenase-like predicted oxidoreductase
VSARELGHTGLQVTPLGFGGGHIGDPAMDEARVEALLRTAVELGVVLFDTARSYGCSEARIGRHLHRFRDRIVLSTKLGYGVDGVPDWTGASVTAGVDDARRHLQADVLDVVHLHSCPKDVLERGEVLDALATAVAHGKVRVAAYSGENDALARAVADERIGAVQTSVNPCDQWSLVHVLPRAGERGLGVVGKRPLANAFWRFASRPHGEYAETYWTRWQELGIAAGDLALDELVLRFSAFAPGVHTCIVGTASVDHLRRNAEIVAKGPLPAEVVASIRTAYRRHDWPGEI